MTITDTSLEIFEEIVSQEDIACFIKECQGEVQWMASHAGAPCQIPLCSPHKKISEIQVENVMMQAEIYGLPVDTHCIVCQKHIDIESIKYNPL